MGNFPQALLKRKIKVQPRGGEVSTNARCFRGLPQVIWKDAGVHFKHDYQPIYSSEQKRTKLVMSGCVDLIIIYNA